MKIKSDFYQKNRGNSSAYVSSNAGYKNNLPCNTK